MVSLLDILKFYCDSSLVLSCGHDKIRIVSFLCRLELGKGANTVVVEKKFLYENTREIAPIYKSRPWWIAQLKNFMSICVFLLSGTLFMNLRW